MPTLFCLKWMKIKQIWLSCTSKSPSVHSKWEKERKNEIESSQEQIIICWINVRHSKTRSLRAWTSPIYENKSTIRFRFVNNWWFGFSCWEWIKAKQIITQTQILHLRTKMPVYLQIERNFVHGSSTIVTSHSHSLNKLSQIYIFNQNSSNN